MIYVKILGNGKFKVMNDPFRSEPHSECMMLESESDIKEAKIIMQGMSSWALKNMIRALNIRVPHTPTESMRLKLAKQELRSRKAGGK